MLSDRAEPPASLSLISTSQRLNNIVGSLTWLPLPYDMRLINTGTGLFKEFIGRKTPEYAILSHTWEEEEVSYQDYVSGAYSHKKGYEKIRKTLELAKKNNLSYAWIDTCCIDKSSSAELTEAINSMYRWYQRSRTCFVYLSDLKSERNSRDLRGCRW